MQIIIFFGVVILFSLTLNVIQKVHSYNQKENRSVWQEGDSVVVKPKDSKGLLGGFGKRISDPNS